MYLNLTQEDKKKQRSIGIPYVAKQKIILKDKRTNTKLLLKIRRVKKNYRTFIRKSPNVIIAAN